MALTKRDYTRYIEDGLWKCNESPTGAHFWIEFAQRDGYGEFRCKYCLDTRWFPITQTACLGALRIVEE